MNKNNFKFAYFSYINKGQTFWKNEIVEAAGIITSFWDEISATAYSSDDINSNFLDFMRAEATELNKTIELRDAETKKVCRTIKPSQKWRRIFKRDGFVELPDGSWTK